MADERELTAAERRATATAIARFGHTEYCRTVEAELDDVLASNAAEYDADTPPPVIRRCEGQCRLDAVRAVLNAARADA